MKYKTKLTPSDIRSLWASRVVIWITIALVLFPALWIVMSSFSAGDSFPGILVPRKVQYRTLCKIVSGNRFYEMGNELSEAVFHSSSNSADFNIAGSICFFTSAVCGEKIWSDVTVDFAGISEQHGCGWLLYSDL